MGRLFGTDGARGIANTEITCELAMKTGRTTATVLSRGKEDRRLKIVIGTDTRKSGRMLSGAIASGLCSVGCDVLLLGVVPTPAVAFLVKKYGCDAGVMISASHNPGEYNGIKIFGSDGYKLSDETENELESIILDETCTVSLKTGGEIGDIALCSDAVRDYVEYIKATAGHRLDGMKIALDCANGSACVSAYKLFSGLGAQCCMMGCEPDGSNINDRCGSTHIEALAQYVRKHSLDAGFAFDGDADRLICVDSMGNVIDGDRILGICAKHMKGCGGLNKSTVVATVMSNMGLFSFLEKNGIACEKTAVGDRYVLEKMLEKGYSLGGEQSGHVIFLDYATTGDGQLTAVQLLDIMKSTGRSLRELAEEIEIYPQVLKNIRVSSMGKLRLEDDSEIKLAIKEAERELANDGRVLVRASGTEPLVRVMTQGKNSRQTERLAQQIAQVIKERLI